MTSYSDQFTMGSKIYTGRVDMFHEEEYYIDFIVALSLRFESEFTFMVFEDQTKAGLDCKPHYHFMIVSTESHDNIKRWMKKHDPAGMSKTNAALKQTTDFDKAIVYMLKQYHRHQYVPFSDFDEEELEYYINLSKNYNDELKLNTWSDHQKQIAENIKKLKINDRYRYIEYIYEYIFDWNAKETTKENQEIKVPNDMRSTILYIESKTLSRDEFVHRGKEDYSMFEMAKINRNY